MSQTNIPTVTFQNQGLIDPIAIATFGINAKNDKDTAIGYFGTGLKYAIAVLLREKQTITILSGDQVYKFGLSHYSSRGKEFSVVTMNDKELGFTTELGKNWEMWMALRELYCNAADEEGFMTDEHIEHSPKHTTVVVQGHAFYREYLNRDTVILETKPVLSHKNIHIHPGESKYVYYKNIRVMDLERPSMYTYNLERAMLTEDRTIKHSFLASHMISSALMEINDDKIIEDVILADDLYEEANFDFTQTSVPSETALTTAERYRLNPQLNDSVRLLLRAHNRQLPLTPITINDIQTKQLERAIQFCRAIEYPVDYYPIVITDELRGGVHGLAENDTIYIAPAVFNVGTKYVAATILEEYIHLATGYGDMTRSLQTTLFDAIITLAERIQGEPI